MSSTFKTFEGFELDFEKHINEWEAVYNSAKPQSLKNPWPGKWNDLTIFHKIIVMRIVRPDKVIPMIEKLIKKEKELGKKYTMPPPFDMGEIFADSTNKTPIIIVLSPGADPMTEIITLCSQKFGGAVKDKLTSLSLGKGQAEKAVAEIKAA